MATQAQQNNTAKARAAKAAKAAQDAQMPPMLQRMLDPDYIRETAVATAPVTTELPNFGTATQEEMQAATPAVPIVDSEYVKQLQADLAAERAKSAVMAAHVNNKPKSVFPEPADSYVADEDLSIDELNMLNGADVVKRARDEGRLKSGLSKILHSNSLSQYDAPLTSSTFWMYAKDGTARRIMRQSVESAKHSGLTATCPKCGGWHQESETNPNACPNKARHKFTMCQVCFNNGFERYIYDTPQAPPLDRFGNAVQLHAKTDDPNFVAVNMPGMDRERLQVLLEDHIRAFHTSTAASMHLAPLERVQAGSAVA